MMASQDAKETKTPFVRCKVCGLAKDTRERVEIALVGDPGDPNATPPRRATPALSSRDAETWVKREIGVSISYRALNSHRTNHMKVVDRAALLVRAKQVLGQQAEIVTPEGPEAPAARVSRVIAADVHALDMLAAQLFRTVRRVAKKVKDKDGDLTLPQAHFLGSAASGLAAMVKARHIVTTGGKGALQLGAGGGIKELIAKLGGAPPLLDGDEADTEAELEEVDGGYQLRDAGQQAPASPIPLEQLDQLSEIEAALNEGRAAAPRKGPTPARGSIEEGLLDDGDDDVPMPVAASGQGGMEAAPLNRGSSFLWRPPAPRR